MINNWFSNNWVEVFGAITGIVFVFLEIRQNFWLWPVGIITSSVYIWVFFTGKLYADMSLQGYYLVISFAGWYWWVRGTMRKKKDIWPERDDERMRERKNGIEKEPVIEKLPVTRLKLKTGIVLSGVFLIIFTGIWLVLSRLTDSPVPGWDSFITSLSIIATWMLARKIYEHWILWIVVNSVSVILFFFRGLYPTVMLYSIYGIMSFAGLKIWKRTICETDPLSD